MIVILFNRAASESLPSLGGSDVIVHANPAYSPVGNRDISEYYLEGYAGAQENLPGLSVPELVSMMSTHKRIELL